jgi:CHAT domain-containing protein
LHWCPTGILSFLPLHAAGDYSTDIPGSKLADYATSSYIPSLKTLIPVTNSLIAKNEKPRILAVGDTLTNSMPLPGVQIELEYIREWQSKGIDVSTLTGSEITTQKVMEEMGRADWVHFACNGFHNICDPNEDALIFSDISRLTLSDITKLHLPSKGLAFLSACETARGNVILADEALHLAAGMLFCGYQGVIATMWPINDLDAASVTRDVYSHLLANPHPNVQNAADALHYAISNLQASGKNFTSWVPFIHIGI